MTGVSLSSLSIDLEENGDLIITEHFVPELQDLEKIRHFRRSQISDYPSLAIVLATSRPDGLLKILSQLEKQSLATFQLFLGIHGYELTASHHEIIERLENRRILVNVQNFEKSITLGVMLTSLANASSSEFIAKIDDDDIYGPQYLQDSLDAIIINGADLVGCALNYIYLEKIDLTVRRFNRNGISSVEHWSDWVCGGTILVRNSIGKESGWFGEAKNGVDQFLLTAVSANGGKIWRKYGAGYIYCRSVDGHTFKTAFSEFLELSIEQNVGIWRNKVFGT